MINIYFQNENSHNKSTKIECLLTEKIKAIIRRYEYKTNNLDKNFCYSFNSKNLDYFDYDKNVEEIGLSNNSKIIVIEE